MDKSITNSKNPSNSQETKTFFEASTNNTKELCCLAIASLTVSILGVFCMISSLFMRIILSFPSRHYDLSELELFLFEISSYLSFILPSWSIVLGIASLIRIFIKRKMLRGKIFAIGGMVVSVGSASIFIHYTLVDVFRSMR